MNLARVEYYLSDILSIIETREYVDGKVTTDPLITENYYGADITAKGKYGVVRIPENLYIIGTVNMDETTFPFSRKVLDRANTIEFSTVELLANFDSTQGEVKAIFADNTFMKADYVFFNQCASDKDFVEDVCIELQDINKILEKANAHVGYRVRDEIVFYMLNNKNAGNLLTRNQAFDHEIMQKILPRIQGSSASVKIMLCELFKYCAGDYESYQTESDDVSAKMMAAANKETCKYKESAKKIAFMVRRFEEDTIMSQPHHVLETTHQVLPSHKVKKTDGRTIRWIKKHPDQAKRVNGEIRIERALAVRKQVSYDTKENQLTKYILLSTARKLESFKKNYLKLQRKEDQAVIAKIDGMVRELNRRCNTTFLADVEAKEASSGMSLVFSMAPGYRDLYKYYLMLLRGLSITGDVFNISVKDLALLYEYWCFIKLNSMMKDRYELISQDIVKVQGNGLFVSLVKGSSSKVKYRNSENGEVITLSYNPKSGQVPTVAQKPDNVLSLEKKTVNQVGKKVKYEYVFDAKYRVNPALEGSDYYNTISHTPGPETDDINTMHRYRDAIVYHNGADPYERTMFGGLIANHQLNWWLLT